ncbi:MAG: AtpZ/AtpI family protein [Yoonia sp.]|jgi:ATP synthase protein I|nr:AtpZ/AtpI family protein [Yoonia sp.]
MSDPHDPVDDGARLKALEAKLAEAKRTEYVKEHGEEHYSQAQQAWRMVIELVAGLGIGFGIGYSLDLFFGTLPIFLVVFIFLGFAAGVKTMMRSAQEMQRKQSATADEQEGENRGN